MKKNNLILIGGGGHCISCIDVIESQKHYKIAGIIDLPEKLHSEISGYKIIASDHDIPQLAGKYSYFLITIGQIKSPQKRLDIFKILKDNAAELPVIISPHAVVSERSVIKEGTIIMAKAFINSGAEINENTIINTGALIEHGARIGAHCHISTSAVINGDCVVEDGVFIGSNAVLCHGVSIKSLAVIGAGAVVTRNIREPGIYTGNPARRII
ncbi:MAG TPA: acetyltransferase [Spirochaetia bacterium]|nr:acetyltransferase [Spirochaetia bacterium]